MEYGYERQVDFFRAENDKKLDEMDWRLVEYGIESFSSMKYGISSFRSVYGAPAFRAEYPGFCSWRTSFEKTKNIGAAFNFKNVISALNNEISPFASFSKSMAVPLFKYASEDGCLLVNTLDLNTVQTEVLVSYRDSDRQYHQKRVLFSIPLNWLASKMWLGYCFQSERFKLKLRDNGIQDCDEIVDIDFSIIGQTLDVSNTDREGWGKYCKENSLYNLKPRVSFQKDLEILTTAQDFNLAIRNPKVLQVVRLIYLVVVNNQCTQAVIKFICDVYEGKYPDLVMTTNEREIFYIVIFLYLLNRKKQIFERDSYVNLYKGKTNIFDFSNIKDYFEFAFNHNEKGFFDSSYAQKVLCCVNS